VANGWLAASLTTLDGRDLGLIQLFDKADGDFTELDEEILVQLAQMASAAVERARLYRR
jgi:GAF domain-containing protein